MKTMYFGLNIFHNNILETTAKCASLETEGKLKMLNKITDTTRRVSEDPACCLGATVASTELWNEKKAEERIERKQKEAIVAQSLCPLVLPDL